MKELVKQWEVVANIKLQFIPNGKDALIRIGFKPRDGSFSYIGRDALPVPRSSVTVNLGFVSTNPNISDYERGDILHQFGHVLGFLEEHRSPRRGEKLTLNEARTWAYSFFSYVMKMLTRNVQVIIEDMKKTQIPPWDESKTRANILDLLADREVTDYSEMNLKSVMM